MAEKPLYLRLIIASAVLWTIIVGGSFVWNKSKEHEQMMEMARAEAVANLNKDITFRRWGTLHGGVYVPVTETQKSVPWLSHVPGRDVRTTDGRQLTLLNPASMLRQMMDLYAEDYGVRGRITGLRYLNPGNAPDEWEKRQLEFFEAGKGTEVWDVAEIDGKPYLRHLRAMYMESGCDKCHGILGYKTGEMRGATGLNLPLAPYFESYNRTVLNLALSHGAIWLAGLLGVAWVWWLVWRWLNEREAAQRELDQHRDHLEEMVEERTAALAVSMRAAEASSRAKSAFLSNMSHELRTPLNAITGMAYMLRRSGLSPKQEERVDVIDKSVHHLLDTINAVLDFSKIEAGKLVLEETPLSVPAIIGNVMSMLGERARAKGLALRSELDAFPETLIGDPIRLQQALLNYVSNAVKFTSAGTVRVRAKKVSEDEAAVFVLFEVEDTGIGIADEAMARLFSEFEQADNSSTRQYGGTGLGLAITRQIARMMDGDAGARSELGVGSTFWFTARLRKPKDGDLDAGRAVRKPVARQLREEYSGSRVLLAEDEPTNRQITRSLLEDVGIVVEEAGNGTEAYDMALETRYAAVLMDVQMPVMDGITATQLIRAIPGYEATPIIALTANAFASDRQRCLAAGMTDYVAKPAEPEVIYGALLRALQGSRSPV